MVSKKKFYRNMSIISFTMVLVLTIGLFVPFFTLAEENDERITMEFSVDKEKNILEVNGKIPSNYNGYELYWANKKYDKEKPQDPSQNAKYLEDTIKWFESSENKIKPSALVEGSTTIKSSVPYKIGNYYSVLCVAKGPRNTIMMSYANYTSSVPVEKKSEEIKIELNNEDKKISIHAYDQSAKITSIKIQKSDKALKVDDFKDNGTVINGFTAGKDVKVTTEVKEYGIYYVYAENDQGSKSVEPIVIKNPVKAQEDDISVEIYRITDEKSGDIAIKANSKTGKISGIKYYISSEPIDVKDEAKRNMVKEKATEMKVYGNATEEIVKSDSEINDDKYIVLFVQSTDGNYNYEYWSAPGKIGNLNKAEVAPWVKKSSENNSEEYEELKEEGKTTEQPKAEEGKKEETKTAEQPKVEEGKKEETKTAEQPKAEEGKKEETKTAEQPKAEEGKKEETKTTEQPKAEEGKKEETKTAEQTKIIESKNSETKTIEKPENEESKKEENKTQNEKDTETRLAELKKDIEASVYGPEKEDNTVTTKVSGDNKSNKALPQTGSNNTWIYVGIIVFSITGICGLIKSRKE